MTYSAAEGRQQILDELAEATDAIAAALAALGVAYEQLDEAAADRLEERLFRPVQAAYGRAKRTHAAFAERSRLPGRTFAQAPAHGASKGVRALVDDAVSAVDRADATLAELQDSMLPVDVGDAELRAGLAEVREALAGTRAGARELVRTFGR